MATAASSTTTTTVAESKPRKVCFSFAAYSKNVIDHLKSCRVPVVEGLTDEEFSSIQSILNFTFPPDLRSILCEGLPVGSGFPNWRSSSVQQLQILINLPILGITKELSNGNFWCESWGEEPEDTEEALRVAKGFLNKAPVLVPIYQNCYISSVPNVAGNPVFYIYGGDLRYLGYDVAGFFQQIEFRGGRSIVIRPARVKKSSESSSVNAPAWAAKTARNIAVWSDLVESGTCGKRGRGTRWNSALGEFFEEMSWKLKEGGWSDEQVREMMDCGEEDSNNNNRERLVCLRDRESVEWHLRFLSLSLMRGGWSREDVFYTFDFEHAGVVPETHPSSLHAVEDVNSNSLRAHLMLLPP